MNSIKEDEEWKRDLIYKIIDKIKKFNEATRTTPQN
jgi:hypothetical protein